jgi:transcription elongation factor Elf1
LTESNWANAARLILEPQLVCPKCGAANLPSLIVIHIEQHGQASCEQCGHGGPIQIFIPKEK